MSAEKPRMTPPAEVETFYAQVIILNHPKLETAIA